MNIFYLDKDPEVAAKYHCDKHVVKMITEYAQLLSSAYYSTGEKDKAPYKPSHLKHPCAIWVKTGLSNWYWLATLGLYLYNEYKIRYNGKTHKAGEVIIKMAKNPPTLHHTVFTEPPLCMPEELKDEKHKVASYRAYYTECKDDFVSWKVRGKPWWYRSPNFKENDYETEFSRN